VTEIEMHGDSDAVIFYCVETGALSGRSGPGADDEVDRAIDWLLQRRIIRLGPSHPSNSGSAPSAGSLR